MNECGAAATWEGRIYGAEIRRANGALHACGSGGVEKLSLAGHGRNQQRRSKKSEVNGTCPEGEILELDKRIVSRNASGDVASEIAKP